MSRYDEIRNSKNVRDAFIQLIYRKFLKYNHSERFSRELIKLSRKLNEERRRQILLFGRTAEIIIQRTVKGLILPQFLY